MSCGGEIGVEMRAWDAERRLKGFTADELSPPAEDECVCETETARRRMEIIAD